MAEIVGGRSYQLIAHLVTLVTDEIASETYSQAQIKPACCLFNVFMENGTFLVANAFRSNSHFLTQPLDFHHSW